MAGFRNDEWNSDREIYTAQEVEAVLKSLGIDTVDETHSEFLSLCPFHGNTHSPAFSTSKKYGFSVCFNPACAVGMHKRMTLEGLVSEMKGLDRISAKRFVLRAKLDAGGSFAEKFDSLSEQEPEELAEFPQSAIDKMHNRFLSTPAAVEYMASRGFEASTMEKFQVGFTPAAQRPIYRAQDMIVVPAYDDRARPVGLVGRSIIGKEFKNYGGLPDGKGFQKSKIIWNLQNAKKYDTIILTEATFDGMAVDESGYPNVGALLGGSLSKYQKALLNRYFSHIIIMTDNENEANGNLTYHKQCAKCVRAGAKYCQGHAAGRDLGMQIATEMPNMKISWAFYDDNNVYARNVKDARAMTSDEIRQSLRNMVSHYDYLDWCA